MLWMWFAPQLCEQTDSYFGQQLTRNSIVNAPAPSHTPGRKCLGNKSHTHNGLDVYMIILWSLWGLDFTTCDNSLWAIVKAKISQLHPTTAEDLKTAFWDSFNDLQS